MANKDNKPKLIVILGPTASGKTDLSLKLAKKFKGEIISADSRAVYKYLDIGSAKPTPKERSGIRHHLIDIAKPNQILTLAQYKSQTVAKIYDIARRKMVPFLVGGTALYVYALIDNWLIPEVPPNEKLRTRLEKWPVIKLHRQLLKKDPGARDFIDPQNKRRVIRALEVIAATDRPFSKQRQHGPQLFNLLILGVKKSSAETKKNIVKRTEQMLQDGLVNEVKKLLKKGYSPRSPALSGIHYKEIIAHLKGEMTLPEAIAQINKNDEQLVRRQMAWFKKDHRIKWVKNQKEAAPLLEKFLQ